MKSVQNEAENWDLTAFKLLPSAKPPLFHGHTVRQTVSSFFWRTKLRPFVLEQQGKQCGICGWKPQQEQDMRHFHLHEVEEYDFTNKVCHLLDIQLICRKCHAFHHIIRTEMVSTKEQWHDLMQHFVYVNDCSPDVVEKFDRITAKALLSEGFDSEEWHPRSAEEAAELAAKPVRYTIHPKIPFAEELEGQIRKKGLLYQTES